MRGFLHYFFFPKKYDDNIPDKDMIKAISNLPDNHDNFPRMERMIDSDYVLQDREETPTTRNSHHGSAHIKRAMEYVEKVAKVLKENQADLGVNVTNDDIIIATYAALFHDSGRKNHEVDVFDETSAYKTQKELKRSQKLSSAAIKKVQDAIKSKDDDVSGKDAATIILHEVDCLDIQRIIKNFDIKFMDMFQLYKAKQNIKDDNEVYNSKFGTQLKELAEECDARIKQDKAPAQEV